MFWSQWKVLFVAPRTQIPPNNAEHYLLKLNLCFLQHYSRPLVKNPSFFVSYQPSVELRCLCLLFTGSERYGRWSLISWQFHVICCYRSCLDFSVINQSKCTNTRTFIFYGKISFSREVFIRTRGEWIFPLTIIWNIPIHERLSFTEKSLFTRSVNKNSKWMDFSVNNPNFKRRQQTLRQIVWYEAPKMLVFARNGIDFSRMCRGIP